jgi:PAS domain S-box-containing protein
LAETQPPHHTPPQGSGQGNIPAPCPPARPCLPWPSATVLAAFSTAALLAFLLRNAAVPEGSARLVVLGLGLLLAGGLLLQALALSRAKASLRASEARLEGECCARLRSEAPVAHLEGVLRAATRISIIATDMEGIITVFNSGAEQMLGYAAEELVGRATPAVIHLPSEVEEYGRLLSERLGRTVQGFDVFVSLAREGGAGAFDAKEWTYLRKDGQPVPVQLTVTGVYSPAGELTGFLGVAVDLTERRKLLAGLRQAQASVDNAQDMIFWARAEDGRYAYVNAAATQHLGYSREELLGMSVLDLNPARTLENWQETVRLLRTQERCIWQGEYRRKDAHLLPVEFNATLIRHEGVEYAVGVVRDISSHLELLASLRQAQLSVDSAGDMIFWVALEDRRVAYVNETACRSLGYDRAELLGADVSLVNPWRPRDEWAQAVMALRAWGSLTYEADYCRRDGSALPVETRATLIRHEGVEYAVGVARDLSERRKAEERLQAEALLNRSQAEVARALIADEPDLKAIASKLLDSVRELTGSRHGYVSIIDQRTGNLLPHSMTAMMTGGECSVVDGPPVFLANPDGSYPGLWGHSLNSSQGMYDNDPPRHPSARGLPKGHVPLQRLLTAPAVVKGRLVGQIALANPERDFDNADLAAVQALADLFALGAEQILSRQALLQAKEAAETSSRAKGDFLANMTHEVRTPLNGVLGMLQVLQASALDPDQQESVGIARESAERLHLLLSNVLEFARLDSAQDEPPQCLSFPPQDLLQALAVVVAPKAQAKGLAFTSSAEPGLPEFMRSDPAGLRQCLEHLLDNAVKFTPSGEVRLSAGAVHEADGQARVAFRVEDTGIGIPADKAEAVFEAFAQAETGSTRGYGGAGLGLAIARRLAQRLGGDIQAKNRPGGGTVMILTVLADCQSQPSS